MPLFPRFSKKNDEFLKLDLAGAQSTPPPKPDADTIVFGKADSPLATMQAQRHIGRPLTVTAVVSMPALKGKWQVPLLPGELRLFAADIDSLRLGTSGAASLHLIPGILAFIVYTDKGSLHFAASFKSGPLFAVTSLAIAPLEPTDLSATIAALKASDAGTLSEERIRYLRDHASRIRTPQVLKEPQMPDVPADRVVLTIGDEQITAAELNEYLESIAFPKRNQRREFFAAQLISRRAAAQEARRRGLHRKPSVRLKMRQYEEELLNSELSISEASAQPDEAACRAYYDSHKEEFECVKWRQIVVRAPGSSLPVRIGQVALDDAQALAKILDIRQRLLGGADFAALAKEESDQRPIFQSGHPFEWRERGAASSAFQDPLRSAAFDLEIGEFSPPVKHDRNYYLIQVEAKRTKEFAEVHGNIQGRLRIEDQHAREEQMQIAARVSLDPEYFSKLYKDESPAEVIAALAIGDQVLPDAVRPGVTDRREIDGFQQSVMLLRAPRPLYPAEAREQGITGRVTLHVLIGTSGRLLEAQGAAGHPLLVEAALTAVRQWQWRPTINQGAPVEVISRVDLEFNLPVPRPPCH